MHTAPYFTAIGLLYVILALRVIRLRWKYKVRLGDGSQPELLRAIRVFGNLTEWAPIGLILLIGLEFVQAPIWYMHVTGTCLLVGRLLHCLGLTAHDGPSPGRFAGMILTFASVGLGLVGVTLFSLALFP